MKKFLETTKCDYKMHIYLLDDKKSKCFGYIQNGTDTMQMFIKPMRFDTRNRTFKEIK